MPIQTLQSVGVNVFNLLTGGRRPHGSQEILLPCSPLSRFYPFGLFGRKRGRKS